MLEISIRENDEFIKLGQAMKKAFLREIKGNRHPLTSIIEK